MQNLRWGHISLVVKILLHTAKHLSVGVVGNVPLNFFGKKIDSGAFWYRF